LVFAFRDRLIGDEARLSSTGRARKRTQDGNGRQCQTILVLFCFLFLLDFFLLLRDLKTTPPVAVKRS
jgi:hypothetical protein